ncbi:MAG TPA: hypothetical protein VGN18_20180 [Jatrophihabitans sp.]|jgi:hypothetical protein|uniref:hypothetical protein n=1 Tax=Jatrophihabitans sp. TaxID=1932789 RepID=UPI002E00010C|nr:hypothetical protein [Jatrophihabitans sp.]
MTSPMERELTRVLKERAASIEVAPEYRLEPLPASKGASDVRARDVRPRPTWAAWVTSTAMLTALVVIALLAWTRASNDHRSEPSVGHCAITGPTPFAAALRAGALPAGNAVLAAAGDGSLLVATGHDGATSAVDVLSPVGTRTRLWTTRPADRVRVVANPSGAFDGSTAVLVLVPTGGHGTPEIMVVDSGTHSSASLTVDAGYRVGTDTASAPVILRSAVSVLETSLAAPARQQIAQYWADSAVHTPSGRTRTSGVRSLLAVGGNVISVRPSAGGRTVLDFDQPDYRPTSLPPAAQDGYAFASDGTTLEWLAGAGDLHSLWQWAPGDPDPIRHTVPSGFRPTQAIGRLAATDPAGAPQQIYDTVTGRTVELPRGLTLHYAVGGAVVLTTAAGGYSRLPTATLLAC